MFLNNKELLKAKAMFGGGSGGGASVIEALSVSATGECTATKIEDGYVAVTVAVPTKNYNNAEGVNF